MLLPDGASFFPPPHTITTYSRPPISYTEGVALPAAGSTSQLIERAEFLVEVRRADEEQAALCYDRTAVVIAARIAHSFRH
jgi:hypothetical protein